MATLTERLGFDPLLGGRRLGELTIQALPESESTVWLEVSGSVVTVAQARAIRAILVGEQIPPQAQGRTQPKFPCRFCGAPHRRIASRRLHERTCPRRTPA